MDLKSIRSICFTICIVSIIVGLLLGIAMIWGIVKDAEFAWKVFMTLGLFFVSALLTVSVARYLGSRDEK
jgi:high-affinity Fe2+/Pb2+ permease